MTDEAEIRKARKEALATAFDALTAYLTDHCPDDEEWEDFEPDLDQIRFTLDDMMRACDVA